MSSTPVGSGDQFVECDVPPEQRRMSLRARLLVSLAIGVLVFGIAARAAHHVYCLAESSHTQGLTLYWIGKAADEVDAYQERNHTPPRRLSDVDWASAAADVSVAVGEDGVPVDSWNRPLHYWTDGKRYRITSYGRDGRPGGAGFDYDLSSSDLPEGRAPGSHLVPPVPRQALPTFWQFATAHDESYHGSGRAMFLISVLTGLVTFALTFREVGKPTGDHGTSVVRWFRLATIVAAALLIAVIYIIPLHAPSGH